MTRRKTKDPLMTLALHILLDARNAFVRREASDEAASRRNGYFNVEHDVLTFLATDWFDLLVEGLNAAELLGMPNATANDLAQKFIDQVYHGKLQVIDEYDARLEGIEIPTLDHKRISRTNKPRSKEIPVLSETMKKGEDLLNLYSEMAFAEEFGETIGSDGPIACTKIIDELRPYIQSINEARSKPRKPRTKPSAPETAGQMSLFSSQEEYAQ